MKTRIILALALVVASPAAALAQTQLVAHKSHSGSAATFDPLRETGFGLGISPDMELRIISKVVRIDDSTAIEVANTGTDTTRHHYLWNNPNVTLDSLRREFPTISFEGFDAARPATLPEQSLDAGGCRDRRDCSGGPMTLLAGAAVAVAGIGLTRLARSRRS